jgi:predicted metal-dependent HD superfamily phosphohydrolase
MTIEPDLVNKSKEFALGIISNGLADKFCYHDLEHTQSVVKAAIEIGENSQLTENEMQIILTAAWMHDTGYCFGCQDHEKKSQEISQKFLRKLNAPDDFIQQVMQCIEATGFPQNPQNAVEEVICDADLYHLSTDEFHRRTELLRQELNNTTANNISEIEWLERNVHFFNKHHYFTAYAKENLNPGKEKNLQALTQKINKLKGENLLVNNGHENGLALETNKKKKEKKAEKQKDKNNTPERGIETMFRTTSRNHLDLSSMADNKANIMISVNSIIVSILLTVLFRKFEEFPNLIIPTVILTTVCLLTIVFAILSTRPNVTTGKFTKEDLLQNRANLLFFGNFHRMTLQDYEWGVKEIMKDSDLLYSSMIKDIYFLGNVLGKKYRFLRISYNIFMYGFIVAVLSFAIAIIFFNP